MKPKIKEIRWNPKLEDNIRKFWEKEKIYSKCVGIKKKRFMIDTPPPYPSGRPWHIGAAAHYSQIDMIARTARMLGFQTIFPIGIDRNGLPVEIYTEKKFNISIHKTSREKFIEYCKTALDDLETEMIQTMKTMGLSGDFENYYRTDAEEYRALTQSTFIELWNRGLVYEDTRPNNYCPACGTTIADAEIIYKELPTQLIYIKFRLKDSDEFITIATTRPEFIASCQTIIAHPDDKRYREIIDKTILTPLYNKEVKIIAHPQANPEFGTGSAMICSYGDYEDVRLFRELKLSEIILLDQEGKMTHNAGKYAGLTIEEARKQIIQDLEKEELIEKKEEIMHRTPTCERSKNPIEIVPMNEWYLKQMEFKKKLKELGKKLIFHPEGHRQLLLDWIDSISIDWPISRRRYYGTEIPIWYCRDCKKALVPKPGKYYQPWKDKPPFKKCECGCTEFIGDTRTFDTWFDSGISPLFISKYKRDENFFKRNYPTALRPQAKDIIRTWLYYTMLRCYQLTGKSPFEHAWIMGYGVDEKGERMSKSRGNVIDPIPLLEKHGADIFRYWNAAEASLGSDFRCSEQRIASGGKFLTKLWNISRFISMFPIVKNAKLTATDKWILAELNKLIEECMKGYKDFNFFIPANKIREFTWNIFADHYIEMIKKRTYGEEFTKEEQKSAWFTLHACLETILQLLAPIVPYMTDFIARRLYYEHSIHIEEFPKAKWKSDLSKLTSKIIEFNSKIWNAKKEKGLSLRDEIKMKIPDNLEKFEKDLKAMHNIR